MMGWVGWSLTFGFGNADDGVDDHDDTGAAEDEEGAICDLLEHDGGELGRLLVCVIYRCFTSWTLVDQYAPLQ